MFTVQFLIHDKSQALVASEGTIDSSILRITIAQKSFIYGWKIVGLSMELRETPELNGYSTEALPYQTT